MRNCAPRLAELADPRGIPYTRHSFHVRYRWTPPVFFKRPEWLQSDHPVADGSHFSTVPVQMAVCTVAARTQQEFAFGVKELRRVLGTTHEQTAVLSRHISTVTDGTDASQYRMAIVGSDFDELARCLDVVDTGADPPLVDRGITVAHPSVAFVFSGQGGEMVGMASKLFAACPVFREAIRHCASHADPLIADSLVELLCHRPPSPVEDDIRAKIALFSLQYALAHTLIRWGVEPRILVGHSLGEYAAACVAGVFSAKDAISLLVERGRVMNEHAKSGAMCAVRATLTQIAPYLKNCGTSVVVAAINGPQNLVLSGDPADLDILTRELEQDAIRTRPLGAAHGFHSPLMGPAAEPLRLSHSSVSYAPTCIPFVSTVDAGREIDLLDADYWVRHMLAPVCFASAIETLASRGVSAYVEIGPGSAISNLIAENLGSRRSLCLSALGADSDAWKSVLSITGRLYVHGIPFDWARVAASTAHRVAMPVPHCGVVEHRADAVHSTSSSTVWAERLERAAAADRFRIARQLISTEVALLRGTELDENEFDIGLIELGVSSLQLVYLARRLSERINRQISGTLAFSYPSANALARFILEALDLARSPEIAGSSAGEVNPQEPIAIVGAACRLPGGIASLDALWMSLSLGRVVVGELPADRLSSVGVSLEAAPIGTRIAWRGSFLQDIAGFDAAFFGMSPREVTQTDPAHRILLEVCWEALESAGIVPGALMGTRTGVFIGIGPSEYGFGRFGCDSLMTVDAHAGLGTAPSVGVGRISHRFWLCRGRPCVAIDTACSSSLVALHSACQSLRAGECTLALAGGVSLLIALDTFAWLAQSGAVWGVGRCKTFSENADGYGRGEGCGMVVLKRV